MKKILEFRFLEFIFLGLSFLSLLTFGYCLEPAHAVESEEVVDCQPEIPWVCSDTCIEDCLTQENCSTSSTLFSNVNCGIVVGMMFLVLFVFFLFGIVVAITI